MAFKIDHRDNPKLHALYVRYAHEELTILKEARDHLFDLSRVTAGDCAYRINKMMEELISFDAAFHDAAAMMLTGSEPPPEEGESVEDQPE